MFSCHIFYLLNSNLISWRSTTYAHVDKNIKGAVTFNEIVQSDCRKNMHRFIWEK
jgi:hypothetical protein